MMKMGLSVQCVYQVRSMKLLKHLAEVGNVVVIKVNKNFHMTSCFSQVAGVRG